VRACWTGSPPPSTSDLYDLPDGVLCLPRPAHPVPLLIGGHSGAALRRAGTAGDGWLAQQALPELDPAQLEESIRLMRAAATDAGRDPGSLRVVLRIVEAAGRSEELAPRLAELEAVGVAEIIIDVSPENGEAPDVYARLKEAVA
jgi:alkanesulfonate monooxygenase SsuD/methylene tetrahydromethanopterin reductase-like flavin-dependent oxidoreductase (luciferase family)